MKMFIKLFFSLLLMVSIFTETSYAKDEIEIQSNVADFYSYGKNPSITKLDNGLVISMVEGQTTDFLYYQLGEEKKGRVEWSDDQIQYAIGKEPSVTILGNGDVLTTYELRRPGTIERIDLYYSIGRYKDGKINWYSKDNLLIRDSWNASITTLSNGKVILSAQKALYDRMDYGIGYQVGNFDEDKGEMTWSESHLFDNGVDPSMEQLDNGYILTVYETGVVDYENEGDFKHRGTGELNYKIGIINE
ncbi:sialidase family protein, partial [Jeotgalibacillus marinus]